MIRSITIFAFFAISTIMVIVLQPGPRPNYTFEPRAQEPHETTRNDVQVLREPQAAPVLNAPDEVIAKLKAAAKPAPEPEASLGTTGSLQRLQAALDASLVKDDVARDAPLLIAAPTPPAALNAAHVRPVAAQAIAPELRDMSWQTLNALNSLAHVSRAPGQEGSLLSSIVRRSMGHVDGTQIVPARAAISTSQPAVSTPAAAMISTRNATGAQQNYVVASGDTLALIAIKLYGSALATNKLVAANPALRENPNALRIGQVLKYSAK